MFCIECGINSFGKKVESEEAEMKKILIAAMALALLATMVGLGVSAYFSDTEAATSTFNAGTLDLKVNGQNGTTVSFTYNNLKPGSQPKHSFKLENIGTVDGYLDLENINWVSTENNWTEPEQEAGDPGGPEGELDDVLNLRMFLDYDGNGWISAGDVKFYDGKVKDLPSNFDLDEPMPAGASPDFIVEIYDWWNTSMDNQAQDDSLVVNITFELMQNAD